MMKSQFNHKALRTLLVVLAFGSMNCEVITALDRSYFPFDENGGIAGAGGQAGTGGSAGSGGNGGTGGMLCVPESDNNDCTDDVCENGVPVSKPAPAGNACSAMGGTQCDGMGACVECLAPADCAGADDVCQTRTCIQGVCGMDFAPVGTSLAVQTAGDCMNDVCDGNGGTIPSIDDADLPNDMNDCTDDVCTGGVASNPPKVEGTVCGMALICNAVGVCVGCNAPSDCAGTDDECKVRTCVNNVCGVAFTAAGTAIMAQTVGDCLEATCDGNGNIANIANDTDLPADDGNACTDEACSAGMASHPPKADGTLCSDSDACTLTDTCQAGACAGANSVICAALDQCHTAGSCNPMDGTCSNPNAADGAPCSDSDACTLTDTCQAGACAGANPVICAALDQCHTAGSCNPMDGTCSNPNAADGAPCSDSDACTQTDTCQAGACAGANPVICAALDQCHTAGSCNPTDGTCSNPNAADGAPCSDNDACTLTDTCQAGACAGANSVICAALDQCHIAGACNPMDGTCSNPNAADGAPCSDSDACTLTDSCQAGACAGANPVICPAPDQCHTAGSCNPMDGTCSNPNAADGVPCSDSDACTQTDSCQAGACAGANPVICAAPTTCPNAVGWWPAENNADGFYGLLNGSGAGVTFVPGQVGQAFSFDGSNDVQILDDPAFNLGTVMTIEAWINYTTVSASLQTIIAKNRSAGGSGFAMRIVSGNLSFGLNEGTINFGASGTTVLPTNTWVHVAVTRNLNVVNLYVNGVLDTTSSGFGMNPLIVSTYPVKIGSEDSVGGRFFTGLIDEVAIYKTELSAAAIAEIVSAGSLGKCHGDSSCNAMSGACISTVTTCLTRLTDNPALANGDYLIDPDGPGANPPLTAYCDMTNGGWTLIQSHNASVATSLATSVGLASGTYLYSSGVQTIANAGSSVRINQRSGSLAIESTDSFPITKLRSLLALQDDATKDTTHWTGTGVGNISYTGNTPGETYPIIFHASGNFSGLHILVTNFLSHGFSFNSENLDVWVK